MVNISKWGGRLGNNLMQLMHAWWIAEHHQTQVSYPPHPFLCPSPPPEKVMFEGIFFYSRDYIPLSGRPMVPQDYREIGARHITGVTQLTRFPVPPDVLVVHIRNGDIFSKNAHPGYVQPPLNYYLKIFQHAHITDLSKVWVVCSDEKPLNPIMQELINRGCQLKQGDLIESTSIIANAAHFVSSLSTFSLIFSYLNPNLKTLYYPDFFTYGQMDGIQRFKVNLPGFIRLGEWKANPEQLELLRMYPAEKVTITHG